VNGLISAAVTRLARGVATGWTGVVMSTPLLPVVYMFVILIADPLSFLVRVILKWIHYVCGIGVLRYT